MIDAIFSSIQFLVNTIFLLVIIGTIGVSWYYANRLKKEYSADFPWGKTALIVGIEILLWIGFTLFWNFLKAFWLPIAIIAVIVIILISRKKRRRY